MIDLKVLRQQPDTVAAAIRNKGAAVNLDLVLELDRKHVRLITEVEQIREKRNALSAAMKSGVRDQALIDKSKALKESLTTLEAELKETSHRFLALYRKVPNIPTTDTPIGFSEEENVVVHSWGEPTRFDFAPRDHLEIALSRGWIDKERASKVTGSRFAYLKGDLVKLQFALINWVFDRLTDQAFLEEVIASAGLALPAMLGLMVLSTPIVRLLFEHGAFTAPDTTATAQALTWLALCLPAHVLVKSLSPAFFAREDTLAPLIATLKGLVVAIVLAVLLGHFFGASGIAAGIALGAWSNAAGLIRRGVATFGFSIDAAARRRLPRIAAAAFSMGALLWLETALIPAPGHGLAQAAILAASIAGAIAAYGLCLGLFGVTGWREAVDALRPAKPGDLRA